MLRLLLMFVLQLYNRKGRQGFSAYISGAIWWESTVAHLVVPVGRIVHLGAMKTGLPLTIIQWSLCFTKEKWYNRPLPMLSHSNLCCSGMFCHCHHQENPPLDIPYHGHWSMFTWAGNGCKVWKKSKRKRHPCLDLLLAALAYGYRGFWYVSGTDTFYCICTMTSSLELLWSEFLERVGVIHLLIALWLHLVTVWVELRTR